MRIPANARGAAAVLLLCAPLAAAGPYPRDNIHDAGYGYLLKRDCTSYCGADNQFCCEGNEICTTIGAQATCMVGQVGVDVYTTTWTETRVYTKTISSTYQVVTTEAVVEQCVPNAGSGQTACGNVCCGSWQTCAWEGQCLDRSTGIGGATVTTIDGVLTTQYSAPYRPTSEATSTTTTVEATGTAIGVVDDDNGLSGGEIAGIVIGVIAGVILLLLLCACCLVKGAWSTIMGMFGRKDHRHLDREKVVIEEERYVRHGSGSRRTGHDSWYGDRPSGAAARKKESGKGLMGMAAGLGTLAMLLGLKRGDKSKPARSRSSYSSSYFTDSYTGSSPSKFSPHMSFSIAKATDD